MCSDVWGNLHPNSIEVISRSEALAPAYAVTSNAEVWFYSIKSVNILTTTGECGTTVPLFKNLPISLPVTCFVRQLRRNDQNPSSEIEFRVRKTIKNNF